MKNLFTAILLTAITLITGFDPTVQRRTGWNGVIPLHSTRANVYRMLGKGSGECQCIYKTPTETVTVDYAEGPCKGSINGWNVPADTVLQVTIRPVTPKSLAELRLDENLLCKVPASDTSTTYLIDLQLGLRYAVQDGHVVTEQYVPIREDNHLRCEGFPAYDLGLTNYRPYDKFLPTSKDQIHAHLDEFAFQLTNQLGFEAYIVCYAGKITSRGAGNKMAQMARDYLINIRKISKPRVFAIDGGFREKAEFELFLIPTGMPPPTPTPTLSLSEVTVIRN